LNAVFRILKRLSIIGFSAVVAARALVVATNAADAVVDKICASGAGTANSVNGMGIVTGGSGGRVRIVFGSGNSLVFPSS
jgi:hypothetical protein